MNKGLHLICFILISLPINATALGDLMLTVQQRAKIDLVRSKGIQPVLNESVPGKYIKLNGFYFKSKDGQHKGTVWVNGQQLDKSLSDQDVVLKGLNETTKMVDVSIKKPNVQIPFKAGQKFKVDNGEILDAFQ